MARSRHTNDRERKPTKLKPYLTEKPTKPKIKPQKINKITRGFVDIWDREEYTEYMSLQKTEIDL